MGRKAIAGGQCSFQESLISASAIWVQWLSRPVPEEPFTLVLWVATPFQRHRILLDQSAVLTTWSWDENRPLDLMGH
jgi:hypothetical protein